MHRRSVWSQRKRRCPNWRSLKKKEDRRQRRRSRRRKKGGASFSCQNRDAEEERCAVGRMTRKTKKGGVGIVVALTICHQAVHDRRTEMTSRHKSQRSRRPRGRRLHHRRALRKLRRTKCLRQLRWRSCLSRPTRCWSRWRHLHPLHLQVRHQALWRPKTRWWIDFNSSSTSWSSRCSRSTRSPMANIKAWLTQGPHIPCVREGLVNAICPTRRFQWLWQMANLQLCRWLPVAPWSQIDMTSNQSCLWDS